MRAGFYPIVLLSGLLCLPAAVFAAAPCERLVASADMQSPPYLWPDPQRPGKFLGAHVDLVKQLSSELQLPIKLLDSGSWFAAQQDVQSGRVDLLLGAFLDLPGNQQFDYLPPATWPVHLMPANADSLATLVPAGQLDSAPVSQQSPAQFLALGKNSACNTPLLRGQLSKKLAELRASGLLDSLLQTNLRLWQTQQQRALPVLDAPNP
ncbi:MAG: transporter substrate-binding domain-containing protein [Pseudomonas sp.]|nr:transporter substrate-binding domain-containing protein [Pseudomonas sp.]